jgi:flagellar protein FliS
MYGQPRPTAYLDNEVLSASRERLIPMLYDGILKNLRRAGKQIAVRDLEGKSQSLQKASAIVYELLGSLDFEVGGELAQHLAGLYRYFGVEILEISRTLDQKRLERLIDMVARLKGAWDDAARQVATDRIGQTAHRG